MSLEVVFSFLLAGALLSRYDIGFAQEPPGQVGAVALEPGAPVEREMGAGDVHAYEVILDDGQFLSTIVDQNGIDVVVTVIGPDGQQIAEVDSPTGTDGEEVVELAATSSGSYRLEIRPWLQEGAEPPEAGRYQVRIDRLLTATEYAEHLAAERANIEAVKQWLADHAIPLRTVEAGHGFEDMQPLREIVGDARLVALGEATHGTREFFQLKHRILEFLVSEMGFSVFAMETDFPEALEVNAYVLTGEGDPVKAVSGLPSWPWDTEEVLDLVEWMRSYNADPAHERKVKFYGFDRGYDTASAAKVMLDYLRRVDPEYVTARPLLADLANPYKVRRPYDWTEEQRGAAVSVVRHALSRLDEHEREYIAETDSDSWALARRNAEMAAQTLEWWSRIAASGVRDSQMAENVRWILEHEGPESKAVLWAHNIHVAKEPDAMGGFLRDTFGSDLVAFGFAFDRGSFQALAAPPAPSQAGVRPFTVGPAREGTVDWALAQAGLGLAAVDLGALPEDGPVAEWWSQPQEMSNFLSNYDAEAGASFWWRTLVVPSQFDALLFVESTTAARPIAGGRPIGWMVLEGLVNLDFEEGKTGEPPTGWLTGSFEMPWTDVLDAQRNQGFEIVTTADRAYRGERSGMLVRLEEPQYGETYGTLGQRISAVPYRGKAVRLRAAVRSEVSGLGNEAYLWLQVSREYGSRPIPFFEDTSDQPITHTEWREYEFVGEVPLDAETIDFGLALVGVGRAWIDAVSVEVVTEE